MATQQQLDEYGHAPDHRDYQLVTQRDYTDDVPREHQPMVAALRFAKEWFMTPDDVLDMRLSMFHERAMIARAMMLRRPRWTGREGEARYQQHVVQMQPKTRGRRR